MANHFVKYGNFGKWFTRKWAESILTFKVTVTFDLITQINRGHLLVMSNLQVKYEDFVINGFQNNQQKQYGLPANRQTDQPTNTIAKKKTTRCSLLFEGGGGGQKI